MPWMIIGDDAGFILLTKSRYVSNPSSVAENTWCVTYFGDYVPFDIRNKWNFCVLTTFAGASSLGGIIKHSPSASYSHYVQRDHSFEIGHAYCGIATPAGSTTYFGQGWASMTGGVGISGCKLGGNFYTVPLFLYTNMLGSNVSTSHCFMGVLPGIAEPIMTNGESTSVMSIGDITMSPIVSPDFSEMLLFIENGLSTNNTPAASSKLVFKIGKGFRNV